MDFRYVENIHLSLTMTMTHLLLLMAVRCRVFIAVATLRRLRTYSTTRSAMSIVVARSPVEWRHCPTLLLYSRMRKNHLEIGSSPTKINSNCCKLPVPSFCSTFCVTQRTLATFFRNRNTPEAHSVNTVTASFFLEMDRKIN